ncbi:hypothetical protein D917_06710 [Trichinella nativa]|uniref:Uncharacterized protein n=1 Tax=Trichinella nativa TaxID=6335 RepID=A0A1Y3ERF8_9BILA|nr:hypothetical protein D917_06710 [Trichinella nativa]
MYINIHDFRTMLKDYEYADQANAPNKKSVVRFLRRNTFPDQVATVQHEVTEERKIDAHLMQMTLKMVTILFLIRCTAVDSVLNITAVVSDFSITAATMGNMHKVIIAIRRHFGDCSFLYKSTVVAARKRSTEISRTLQAQAVSPPIKNGTYIMHTEMLIDSGLQYNITDLYTAMMIYRSLQSSKLDSYSAQNKDIQHK